MSETTTDAGEEIRARMGRRTLRSKRLAGFVAAVSIALGVGSSIDGGESYNEAMLTGTLAAVTVGSFAVAGERLRLQRDLQEMLNEYGRAKNICIAQPKLDDNAVKHRVEGTKERLGFAEAYASYGATVLVWFGASNISTAMSQESTFHSPDRLIMAGLGGGMMYGGSIMMNRLNSSYESLGDRFVQEIDEYEEILQPLSAN